MRHLICSALAASLIASPGSAKPRDQLRGEIIPIEKSSFCGAADANPNEIFGAILAAVLPGLIQAGVKGIGTALSKAAAPDEAQVRATTGAHFYTTGGKKYALVAQHPCFAYIVDAPVEKSGAPTIEEVTLESGVKTYRGSDGRMDAAHAELLYGKGFRRYPLFFMVARIDQAADRSAWRMVPTRVWTGPAFTVGGLRGKGRDLVLTAFVEGSSANDESNMLAQKSVNFARAKDNSWVESKRLEGLGTGWIPFPKLSHIAEERRSVAIERLEAIAEIEALPPKEVKPAQGAQLAKMKAALPADAKAMRSLLPVTYGFSLQETRDGNRFLQKVGDYIAGNAETIAKPIAAEFDVDAKREKAVANAGAATGLKIAAIEAVDAWEGAVADPSKNEAQRRVLKMKAQLACATLRASDLDDIACGKVD